MKAITQESGVFNDGPLTSYLTNIMNEKGPIKRKFMVSAVDVNTGTYVLFDEKNVTTYAEQVKAVVSSSSMPFIFPNQQWSNLHDVLMDGGTVYNTNLVSAVQRCRE